MNTDIRVKIDLSAHPKYKRLKRLIGESPMEYLIVLWGNVAKYKPNGELTGWEPGDIEDYAGWNGTPGALCKSLIEVGFLDVTEGGFYPHDWSDHQTWAIGAVARSEKAKRAANVRWERSGHNSEHATGMLQACSEHATSNAPPPSPSPLHKTLTTEEDYACEKMSVSEIQKLHVDYLGKIPVNQPAMSALLSMIREYPPERLRTAFKAVVVAEKPNINWIRAYLDNPNNWNKIERKKQAAHMPKTFDEIRTERNKQGSRDFVEGNYDGYEQGNQAAICIDDGRTRLCIPV